MAQRNQATLPEFIKIHEHLKNVLVKVEGTDYWEYQDSWTDDGVAAAVGAQMGTVVSGHSVTHARVKLFGKLRPWNPITEVKTAVDDERIKKLEDTVAGLQSAFAMLEKEFATLQKSLEGKTIAIADLQRKNHQLQNGLDAINEDLKKRDIDIGRLKLKAKFA